MQKMTESNFHLKALRNKLFSFQPWDVAIQKSSQLATSVDFKKQLYPDPNFICTEVPVWGQVPHGT